MSMPQLSVSRWAALLAVVLVAVAGCDHDEIHTYTVPHPPPDTFEAKVRLLAAVFDEGDDQWFFKLVGPTETVNEHAGAFERFVESVRFTGKAERPVDWTVPAGWVKGPGDGGKLRYATFYPGGKSRQPELTVFKFDRISPLEDNVERWCRLDLGRRAPTAEELDKVTRKIRAGKEQGVLVDMTGPGPRKGKKLPMGGRGGPAVRTPAPLPIKYVTPEGWTETGPRVSTRGGISVRIYTAFAVGDDKKAETTVQVFPARFGNWEMNVNRWRGDVGLGLARPGEAAREKAQTIKAAGIASPYLDLVGKEKRSLVVVLTRGDQAWFFKLLGDRDVVAANKSKFESFVQSVKFTGAADE
jgi:hypothetical protein